MLYDVNIYYLNSKTDNHLIRYDVIKIDNNTYLVKVIDKWQQDGTAPNLLRQVGEFHITREEYIAKYNVGNLGMVKMHPAPGFENTIKDRLQEHRDSLS